MTIEKKIIENLIQEMEKINVSNKKCYYGKCQNKPILSHTIPMNFLSHLNKDLNKIVSFNPSIFSNFNSSSPQVIKKLNKNKFSTFYGFCQEHDNFLFRALDKFNGEINNEVAALVHYRNICNGIYLIKIQIERLHHVSRQNYISSPIENIVAEEVHKLLQDGSLREKLKYCLYEHLSRKEQLEKMIKSGRFCDVKYMYLCGNTTDNPLFCGRSMYLLHKGRSIFKTPGYSFMPWISYMTLRTNQLNYLIFCWLKEDQEYANDLDYLYTYKQNEFKDILAVLAYAASDALAVTDQCYLKHKRPIEGMIKKFRLY